MAKRVALVEYVVRVMPPDGEVSNEVMYQALSAVTATLEHTVAGGRSQLAVVVEQRFLSGSWLEEAGFTVEVERDGDDEGAPARKVTSAKQVCWLCEESWPCREANTGRGHGPIDRALAELERKKW